MTNTRHTHSAFRSSADEHFGIFRHELHPDIRPHSVRPKTAKIIVEIAELRIERKCVNPGFLRAGCKVLVRLAAGCIIVAGDIETAQHGREVDRRQVRG